MRLANTISDNFVTSAAPKNAAEISAAIGAARGTPVVIPVPVPATVDKCVDCKFHTTEDRMNVSNDELRRSAPKSTVRPTSICWLDRAPVRTRPNATCTNFVALPVA